MCLSYLLLDEFNRQFAYEQEFENNTPPHAFLDYAAKHWVTHYQQAGIKDNKSMLQSPLDVCSAPCNRYQRWFRICWRRDWFEIKLPDHITDLMFASYSGLEAIVRLLLEQDGIELNLRFGSNSALIGRMWREC